MVGKACFAPSWTGHKFFGFFFFSYSSQILSLVMHFWEQQNLSFLCRSLNYITQKVSNPDILQYSVF